MAAGETVRRHRWRTDLAWTLALSAAIYLPLLLGTGFWLVGDMVFVPSQPMKAAWWGLDGALPRAVPMDGLIAAVTTVVPGAVVQRVLSVGGMVAGGLGIARLVARHAWFARAGAISLFLWNPWVYERLLIGQWAILLGYLLLPWTALAARRIRDDPRAWPVAGAPLVAAAICSPSSGTMAAATLVVLATTRRTWWRVLVVGVVANLTWAVPSLVAARASITATGVFEAFAARAESSAGVLASLASLGGIWKTSILPGERTSAVLVLLSCLLSLAAVAGLRRAAGRREARRMLLLAGGALVVAVLPTLPAGADLLEALAQRWPGLALLRDSHRFLAPLAMVLAVGAAGAVTSVRAAVRPGREAWWSAVGLLVIAPILLLPSLAWGAAGELRGSHYPGGWDEVAAIVDDDPGTTVVLPWTGSYRGFAFNHRRAVLDPAPRYLPGEVLIDDRVILDGFVVPAEDPRVRAITTALDAPDAATRAMQLRAEGVRWVLVEEGLSGTASGDLPTGRTAWTGDDLRLIDLAVEGTDDPRGSVQAMATVRTIFVIAGHVCAFVLLFASIVWILRYRE